MSNQGRRHHQDCLEGNRFIEHIYIDWSLSPPTGFFLWVQTINRGRYSSYLFNCKTISSKSEEEENSLWMDDFNYILIPVTELVEFQIIRITEQ